MSEAGGAVCCGWLSEGAACRGMEPGGATTDIGDDVWATVAEVSLVGLDISKLKSGGASGALGTLWWLLEIRITKISSQMAANTFSREVLPAANFINGATPPRIAVLL